MGQRAPNRQPAERRGAAGRAPAADRATPRFATAFTVRHHEMDALGHVNNAVYLHYLEQAAIDHAAALGFTIERLREIGGLFIARRHEIDYLRPATAGDLLQVVTWAVELKGAQALRDYEIHRHGRGQPAGDRAGAAGFLPPGQAPAGDLLVRARTLWVFVDPARGRPRRLPPAICDAFLTIAPGVGS